MHNDHQNLDRYLADIAHLPSLTEEQQHALLQRLPEREAEHHLIQAYLPRVVQIAQHYHDQGVALADLIGEGNVCLVQLIRSWHAQSRTPLEAGVLRNLHHCMAACVQESGERSRSIVHPRDLPQGQAAHHQQLYHAGAACTPEQVLLGQEAWHAVLLILVRLTQVQRRALAHSFGFSGSADTTDTSLHTAAGLKTLTLARHALRDLRTWAEKGGSHA